MPRAASPGTSEYFPALLAHIRAAVPVPLNTQVHPVLLQSLLLCLIAGRKNVILRTTKENIGYMLKLTVAIISAVFGYTTHQLQIQSAQHPAAFLDSIFTRPPHPSGLRKSRSGSLAGLPHPLAHASSYPSEIGEHSVEGIVVEDKQSIATTLYSQPQAPSSSSTRRPRAEHSSSDPLPLHPPHTLPQALVVSGLENAGFPAQRALAQALTERRIEVDGALWDFPLDALTIVVYVSAWDVCERPTIHQGLLDRFALSANVTLPTTHGNARPSSSSSSSGSRPASARHLRATPNPNPLITPSHIAYLQALASAVHIHPSLEIYILDLFAATRHHPELDGTLLTTRAHRDAHDLARAYRVLFGDSSGINLLVLSALELSEYTHGDNVNSRSLDGFPNVVVDEANTTMEQLDASQKDIAVIMPRVVSHRLRVRNGPEDEPLSSVLYGAVPFLPSGAPAWPAVDTVNVRRTVKEILVEILGDV